jgi:hydrogenase 3 maturation protease
MFKAEDFEKQISDWISDAGKIAVVGVGNELKKDDYIGSFISKKLKEKEFSSYFLILDCGTVPENYTGIIKKFHPSHILVIDAAQLGIKSGNLLLVDIEEVKGLSISTHNLPLKLFADYLKRETGAKIALLGIQPKKIDFEIGLTKELQVTADEVVKIISKLLTTRPI